MLFINLICNYHLLFQLFHSNVQLVALYNAHLDAANAFYHHLLFQIRDNFDVPVISLLDWLSNNDTHKRKIEGILLSLFRTLCVGMDFQITFLC